MSLKKHILNTILLVSTFFGLSQNPTAYIADWKGGARGAYSIIHDDYGAAVVDGIWQYADTICFNRGIKFTFGAIANSCEAQRNVNGYSDAYDYAKNVMMAQHSHEIMNHSHTHTCAIGNAGWSPCGAAVGQAWGENPSSSEFNQQIRQAHNSIENGTGFKPIFYIFPYDRFTQHANDTLKSLGYLASRTGWSSPTNGNAPYYRNGYENSDSANFFPDADGFFRTSVQVFDDIDRAKNVTDQITELNEEIDHAMNKNMWATRELHNVGNAGWGSVKEESYRSHIDYVKSKMDTKELWVATVSEILTYQMQKIKTAANANYDAGLGKIIVTWSTINPQYNVNVPSYLSPLSIKTPITLVVDLDGIAATWVVQQDGNTVTDFFQVSDKLYINVYPQDGDVEITKLGSLPNQNPVVENYLPDYPNLAIDFIAFDIDLKNVFEDLHTIDDNLLFSYSGNTNVQITINNGIATISSVLGWEGTETITFTAEDEGGLTTSDEFYITTSDFFVGHTPFNNTPISIPGILEVEDFDQGDAEVVYHEVNTSWEPSPSSNPYRSNHEVDLVSAGIGGYKLSFCETGEWVDYTIIAQNTDKYKVTFRIAQKEDQWGTSVGKVRLKIDNQIWMPTMTTQFTPSYTDYANVEYSTRIPLTAGGHLLRLEIMGGGVDIDYIDFEGLITSTAKVAKKERKISLYPNPAKTILHVEGEFTQALIYNQMGTLVTSSTDVNIDVRDLAEGVYYVNVDDKMLKFVKIK